MNNRIKMKLKAAFGSALCRIDAYRAEQMFNCLFATFTSKADQLDLVSALSVMSDADPIVFQLLMAHFKDIHLEEGGAASEQEVDRAWTKSDLSQRLAAKTLKAHCARHALSAHMIRTLFHDSEFDFRSYVLASRKELPSIASRVRRTARS